jgi:hypothetical protein
MKTMFISGINVTLLSMLIVLNSFAQRSDYKNESAYTFSSHEISKMLPSLNNDITSGNESKNISEKVLVHFNKKFPNITKVSWYQVDGDFLAKFSTGETSTNSLFDTKGRLLYTIIFSSEKGLPWYEKKMITTKYAGYTILVVAKVNIDNRKIWVVKLAGKSNIVETRIEDGEMEEMENIQRAN